MTKNQDPESRDVKLNGRVLTRVLAEDLRNVQGGCRCSPATPTITSSGGDITNVGGDGDAD